MKIRFKKAILLGSVADPNQNTSAPAPKFANLDQDPSCTLKLAHLKAKTFFF